MEHGCREHRISTGRNRWGKVAEGASTTARDDRHYADCPHGAHEFEVKPGFGAVGIDRVHEQFTDTSVDCLGRPCDRIEIGLGSAAVRGDDKAGWHPVAALHIEREHQHLCAKAVSDLADERRSGDRCRVDADLVSAVTLQSSDILGRSDSPAHGERDEHLLGRAADRVEHRGSPVDGCRDVEECEFVSALLAVGLGQLNRVSGVTQIEKVDTLHHATSGHIEARDDADRDPRTPG